MHGSSLNQSPLEAPQKSPMGLWILAGVAGVLLLGGLVYILIGSSKTPESSTSSSSPASSKKNSGINPSLNANDAILQDTARVTAGHSPASIDEDIRSTNIDALDTEVSAMDQEAKGL